MSNFTISTDVFKKVLQLIKVLVPQKENVVMFEIKDGGHVLIQCGCQGVWLEHTLEVTEVDSSNLIAFAAPLAILQKFKFPGKEIHIEAKSAAKKNVAAKISMTSGKFKGSTLCVDSRKALLDKLKDTTELTHCFDRESLVTGLKFLAFKPVDLATKSKVVRLLIDNKKMYLSTNDDFRGCYYCCDTIAENIDTVIDFSAIMSALSLLPDSEMRLGLSSKQIRVQCGFINFECLLQFVTGTLVDIVTRIEAQKQNEVKCAFDVSARDFKTAISSVSGVLSAEEEIRIYLETFEGKEVKKSPEDKEGLKIYTRGATVYSAYTLPIDNLEGGGKYSVSSKLIRPLLVMDDFIRLSFYDRVLVIESLKHQLKFMLPQLAVLES